LHDALFLAITPDTKLAQVIAAGRPGTLMPAFGHEHGGPLTPAQVASLTQGLRGWGPFDAKLADTLMNDRLTGDPTRGALTFSWACAHCHGDEGKGFLVGKQPAPGGAVNNASFLALLSETALRRLVITGRPDLVHQRPDGTKLYMPSYRELGADKKPLQPQEIADLAALLAYWKRG